MAEATPRGINSKVFPACPVPPISEWKPADSLYSCLRRTHWHVLTFDAQRIWVGVPTASTKIFEIYFSVFLWTRDPILYFYMDNQGFLNYVLNICLLHLALKFHFCHKPTFQMHMGMCLGCWIYSLGLFFF